MRLTPKSENSLLPSWRNVYKDASGQLYRALDDVQRLSASERRHVASQVLNTLRGEYMSPTQHTPCTNTVAAVQSQQRRLPKEWVCGVFDKGIVGVWGGCKQLF